MHWNRFLSSRLRNFDSLLRQIPCRNHNMTSINSENTNLQTSSSTTSVARKCLDTRPLIISGPSGVGKGSLCKLLLSKYPHQFATTVSHTTRAPRVGEVPGQDYYFISYEEFQDLIRRSVFVEYAQFGGNYYGTSKETIQQIMEKGRIPVLDIEMEGVKQIKASQLAARFIFIAPPSVQILEERLRGRATDKEESIQKRLAQAQNELAYAATEGAHDITITNDNLQKAFELLENFIFVS